jgi:hypothetical protein
MYCYLFDGSGPSMLCSVPGEKLQNRLLEGKEYGPEVWISLKNAYSGPKQSDSADAEFHLELFLREDSEITLLSLSNPLVIQRKEYFQAIHDHPLPESRFLPSRLNVKWKCSVCHCTTYIPKPRCFSCRKLFDWRDKIKT